MGLIDRLKPANKCKVQSLADYISGHPNIIETNIRGYIVLNENRLTFYRGLGRHNEKKFFFELPYEKIVSIGGNGYCLGLTVIGKDNNDNKVRIPINFDILETSLINDGEINLSTKQCNKLKLHLDKLIPNNEESQI